MTGKLSWRRNLALGTALMSVCGFTTAIVAAAPSANAATCSSSGKSSNLKLGPNGISPTMGTIWTAATSGCSTTISLTKGAKDSYIGYLQTSSTGKWAPCNGGKFKPYSGSGTLSLCTSVRRGTKFAVVQKSNTQRNISVSWSRQIGRRT